MSDEPLNSVTEPTPSPRPKLAPVGREDLDTAEHSREAAAAQLENKQADFDLQAADLLPLALQAIQAALESDNHKDALAAAKLLMRNQGRLVDKVQTVDKDALTILLEDIRRPRPIIKTLPNPKDYIDGKAKNI